MDSEGIRKLADTVEALDPTNYTADKWAALLRACADVVEATYNYIDRQRKNEDARYRKLLDVLDKLEAL